MTGVLGAISAPIYRHRDIVTLFTRDIDSDHDLLGVAALALTALEYSPRELMLQT